MYGCTLRKVNELKMHTVFFLFHYTQIFQENVIRRKGHAFAGLSPKFNTANETASRPSPMTTYFSTTGSPEDAGLACTKKAGEGGERKLSNKRTCYKKLASTHCLT
jgi:hypothetical protein